MIKLKTNNSNKTFWNSGDIWKSGSALNFIPPTVWFNLIKLNVSSEQYNTHFFLHIVYVQRFVYIKIDEYRWQMQRSREIEWVRFWFSRAIAPAFNWNWYKFCINSQRFSSKMWQVATNVSGCIKFDDLEVGSYAIKHFALLKKSTYCGKRFFAKHTSILAT